MGRKKPSNTGELNAHHQSHHHKQVIDSESQLSQLPRRILVVATALVICYVGRNHVAQMFESDRQFSHLSSLEREMSFRTEMGLYYSYYQTVINAPSFYVGLKEIMYDNVTEYPTTINTLKRFNLYPEVMLGAMYRAYVSAAAKVDLTIKQCWETNRGDDLPPIISCEGMGDEFYFYINNVFLLAGTVPASLFLLGLLLSESYFGGLLASAAFFANHGEATRVQWTPPLRESFGYPIFIAQMLLVSYVVKERKTGVKWALLVAFFTCAFMCAWQFAQFALSTQVGSLFLAYILDYLRSKTALTVIRGQTLGFFLGYALLFGNEMLLTSLFLSSIITFQVICLAEPLLNKITFRPLLLAIEVAVFAAGTIGLKLAVAEILGMVDDAHIFSMLKAKFTDYKDFHTQLYTCAAEFDFLGMEVFWKFLNSALLPVGAAGFLAGFTYVAKTELSSFFWRDPSKVGSKEFNAIVYNVFQFGAFAIMAILIMRLKLFFTPHLCLMCCLLASQKLLPSLLGPRLRPLYQWALVGLAFAAMVPQGRRNLQQQWDIRGSFANPDQEQLFGWIGNSTAKGVCGSMMEG